MPLFQLQYAGHTDEGETWNFSWWADSTGTVDTVAVVANDWLNAFWTGGYDGLCTAGVGVDQINTREIIQGTGQQIRLVQQSSALSGVATGNSFPADVSIVVSLRTLLANRSGRGRFYLPQPAVSTGTAGGRLTSAAQTALMAALLSGFTAASPQVQPVVYSRTLRTFEAITTFNVGDLFDTQRRRENKLLEARVSNAMP